MNKSTKKVKEVLNDLPIESPSIEFVDKLKEQTIKQDQVTFDSEGDVHIGGGLYASRRVWNVWIVLLWMVLSYPLYTSLLNAYNVDNIETTPVVIPIEEEPEVLEIFTPIEDILNNDVTTIEDMYNDLPFIWEAQDTFDKAFKVARSFLGPNKVFIWNGKEYTTLFKEEVGLHDDIDADYKW